MTAKRDPEATRAAILDAAEEVFLERGVADATTSEISELADVTKSLIHHHFGSKEDLWSEVKVRRFTVYAHRQLEVLEGAEPTADLLRESVELYFRFLQENPEMIRLLAWMFLEGDEECSDLDRKLTSDGVETIRRAQERGELRDDIDAHFVLVAFLSMVQHWFQFREHFCRDAGLDLSMEEADEGYLEAVRKIYFRGVLPPGQDSDR